MLIGCHADVSSRRNRSPFGVAARTVLPFPETFAKVVGAPMIRRKDSRGPSVSYKFPLSPTNSHDGPVRSTIPTSASGATSAAAVIVPRQVTAPVVPRSPFVVRTRSPSSVVSKHDPPGSTTDAVADEGVGG